MSICAGKQRWTVSSRDRRGSCEQLGTLGGWLGSRRVPRLQWNEWRRFSSALGPLRGNPSRSSLRGKGQKVAPGPWSLSHPGSGMRAGTPAERGVTSPSAGETGAARGGGTGGDPGTAPRTVKGLRFPRTAERGIFYSQNKARTIELMRERQAQSRSEIPGEDK